MPRIKFVTGQFYHIYNRGVEKRKIFLDKKDYFRFVHDLYELNDKDPVFNLNYYYGSPTSIDKQQKKKERKMLVEILCWTLMPNHYHLLLKQLDNGGISKFLQKLGVGYTNYFNKKYERNGVLFQGRTKAVPINNDNQLTNLSCYIHVNSVKLFEPNWGKKGIKNLKRAEKFLKNYRWSSYPDYAGGKNFPSVINKNFLVEYFGNQNNYEKFIKDWLSKDAEKNKRKIQDLILER